MRKFNSIKIKLVVGFTAIILLAIVFISIFILSKDVKVITRNAENTSVIMAEGGAKLVAARVTGTISTLNAMAMQDEITTMDWERQQKVLQMQLQSTDYLVLGVVTPDGTTRYTDGSESQLGDRDYIIKAFSGEGNISDVLISRVTGEPVTMVAVPIQSGGKVVGVLIGRRDGNLLSTITKDMKYSEKGFSYMLNNAGTIIAHDNKDYVLEQFNPIEAAKEDTSLTAYAETIQAIIDNGSGFIKYENKKEDGSVSNLYAGYSQVPGTNWIFVSTSDEEEVLAPVLETQNAVIFMLMVSSVILAVVIYATAAGITKPTTEMSKVSQSIAGLDLTVNIPERLLKKKDENGVLARAMQEIMLNLRKVIGEVTDSAMQVSATAQELTATTVQSATAVDEVSKTVEEIAKGASEQASNTEAGSSQAILLGNHIEQNNESIQNVNRAYEKVSAVVDDGLAEIARLTRITEDNGKATDEIHEIILKTSESADRIGEASSLIASIADQTNLLALNASIEAARAGELGKGFAVVASEIKKLAGQSANSTDYIDGIVKELQVNVARAVSSMEQVRDTTKEQTRSVTNTNSRYERINEAMHASIDIMKQLGASGKEMEGEKNVILDMLQTLSAIAEENAASTEEASSSMLEQSSSMEEIAGSSERLAELAADLQQAIRRFKV